MTARKRPAHGTYERYSGKPGCTSGPGGRACKKCRAAKAAYMRERRAAAHAARAAGTVVEGDFRHGTRAGYEEHGCTCDPCSKARASADKRYRLRHVEAQRGPRRV